MNPSQRLRGGTTVLVSVLVLVLVTAAGCSAEPGPEPGGQDGAPAPTAESSGAGGTSRPCPRLAEDPEDLVDRLVVRSAQRLPDSAATLCHYGYRRDTALSLEGQPVQVGERLAKRLWEQFTARSLAMVDCEPTPERGVFAVLDRGPEGEPRVVTVDLGLCAGVDAEVDGEPAYGLATRRHVTLLERAWAGR